MTTWSCGANVFLLSLSRDEISFQFLVPVGVLSYWCAVKYSTGVSFCPVENHLICIQWLPQFDFNLFNNNLRRNYSPYFIPFTSFWKPAGGQVWWIWLYLYCTEVRWHAVYLDYIFWLSTEGNLVIDFFLLTFVHCKVLLFPTECTART